MASELSRLIEDELKNKGYYVEDKDEPDVEAPHAVDEHRALIGALRVEARVKEQNAQKHLLGLKRAVCIGGGIAIVCVVWIVLVVKSSGTAAPVQRNTALPTDGTPQPQDSDTTPAVPSDAYQPPASYPDGPPEDTAADQQSTPSLPPPLVPPPLLPPPLLPPTAKPATSQSPPPAVTPKAAAASPPPTASPPPPPPPPPKAKPASSPPPLAPPPDTAPAPNQDDTDDDQNVADDGVSPPPPKFIVKPPRNSTAPESMDLQQYEDYTELTGDENEREAEGP